MLANLNNVFKIANMDYRLGTSQKPGIYRPRLPAPPPLLEPPPPRPIPPPRLLLLLPPPKDERELPGLLPDTVVREVRAGRDVWDDLDGLGVGMNIGRVLLRDRRELSNGDLSYCDPP